MLDTLACSARVFFGRANVFARESAMLKFQKRGGNGASQRGRGERRENADSQYYCRLGKIALKVKFGSNLGKQGHSCSENLFRASKRKECFGVLLAEICKEV